MNFSKKSKFRHSLILLLTSFLFHTASAQDIKNSALSDGTILLLNGISKVKQYSKDYYLAALYLGEGSSSAENIDYQNTAKRMQLIIVVDKISARSFGRYWKETISINNDKSIWQDQVQDVIEFSKIFKKTLHKGDIVNIDYLPGKGTYVSVNGDAMGRIRGQSFYSLVLMTWIGPRPPSEQFKRGLLGRNDSTLAISLQKEYEAFMSKS